MPRIVQKGFRLSAFAQKGRDVQLLARWFALLRLRRRLWRRLHRRRLWSIGGASRLLWLRRSLRRLRLGWGSPIACSGIGWLVRTRGILSGSVGRRGRADVAGRRTGRFAAAVTADFTETCCQDRDAY